MIRQHDCTAERQSWLRPISRDEFVDEMQRSGVPRAVADFLWEQFSPYYIKPAIPHPSDRINSDLRIDPDDLTWIAVDYGKKFGRHFIKNPIEGPADPSICDFALSLDRGSLANDG